MKNINTGDRVRVIQDCRCQGREGVIGWTDGEIFEVVISGMNAIGLSIEGIELVEKSEVAINKEVNKVEKKIVSLKDVEVEVVKMVGVIEFLEREIELEGMCLKSHEEKTVEYKDLGRAIEAEAHSSCAREVAHTIKRLKSRKEVQEQVLLEIFQLDYKGGKLYRYDDFDHEAWLEDQIDPYKNGGVL